MNPVPCDSGRFTLQLKTTRAEKDHLRIVVDTQIGSMLGMRGLSQLVRRTVDEFDETTWPKARLTLAGLIFHRHKTPWLGSKSHNSVAIISRQAKAKLDRLCEDAKCWADIDGWRPSYVGYAPIFMWILEQNYPMDRGPRLFGVPVSTAEIAGLCGARESEIVGRLASGQTDERALYLGRALDAGVAPLEAA